MIERMFLTRLVPLVALMHTSAFADPSGRELFAGACSACHGVNGEGGHGPSLTGTAELRRATDQDLFRFIRHGVPGTDMPAFRFPDAQVQELVKFVRSLSAPAIDSPLQGDIRAGREIFFGKGQCAGCHMIRGQGGFPGPDLTEAGAQRTLMQLQQALLDPAAHPRRDFRAVRVVTAGGQEIRGVARSHTNYSLAILDSRGELHLLDPHALRQITFDEKPLMPTDYARRLMASEIQDVLAFLSRQSLSRRSEE